VSALLLPGGGFRKQPQYAAKLNNGSNEFWRYVEQAYFAAGWQLNDLGSAKRSLANIGASISAGREGPAFKTGGSTSSYFSSPSAALSRFSLEAFYTPNAAADQYICGIQEAPNSTVHDRELRIDSSGKFVFYIFSGGARQAISTSSAAVNTPVHLLGISDGKNINLYVNGVLETSMAAGDAYAGYASPEFIVGTGRLDANTLIPGSGWLNYAIYHNKALSAAEARGRYDSKFFIFGAPARRLFLAASRNDLFASARIQPNAAGIAAVTQVHALAGNKSAQANSGDTAAIVQARLLAPAAPAQSQAAGVVAITQHNILAGAASTQANLGVAMPAFQGHFLLPVPAMQANPGETGEVVLTLPASLAATGSMQGNAAGMGGVGRGLALPASGAVQGNIASTAATMQKHLLAVPSWSIQGNASGIGSMLSTHNLFAANPAQANICGAAAIGETLLLAVAASRQFNFAAAATMGGTTIEPALARAGIKRTSIKKPGIPASTPEWLKTMMEILTGRRGNRIEVPKFEQLTFSETPTRSECEALYSYTNAVRAALEQVISRMDG
jgi:hypothetical protein